MSINRTFNSVYNDLITVINIGIKFSHIAHDAILFTFVLHYLIDRDNNYAYVRSESGLDATF